MRKGKRQNQDLNHCGLALSMCHNTELSLSGPLSLSNEELVNIGAFGSGCFEGLLRPIWSLLPEAIIMRKGERWKESARWRASISRGQIPPRPVPYSCFCFQPWHTIPQHPGHPGEVPGTLRPFSGAGNYEAVATNWALANKRHNSVLGKAVAPSEQWTAQQAADAGLAGRLARGHSVLQKTSGQKPDMAPSRAPTTSRAPQHSWALGIATRNSARPHSGYGGMCNNTSFFSTFCGFQIFFNIQGARGRIRQCHPLSELSSVSPYRAVFLPKHRIILEAWHSFPDHILLLIFSFNSDP